MSIRDWFGKKPDKPAAPSSSSSSSSLPTAGGAAAGSGASIPLPRLIDEMAAVVPHHAGQMPALDLVRARFADGMRDQGRGPSLPEEFAFLWQDLNEETKKRVAVVVDALRRHPVPFPAGLDGAAIAGALIKSANERPLVTLALLKGSRLRVEELARGLLANLRVDVNGETREESAQRLTQLDYTRLTKEAEAARVAAEQRMAELAKRKLAQEGRTGARSKR
ncbi:MAG: hypothetical protein Q8O67_29875 [Deltaproteobacteria bacterium]|nr:hypothetical protein [Deltaproteobacteria bacterium]